MLNFLMYPVRMATKKSKVPNSKRNIFNVVQNCFNKFEKYFLFVDGFTIPVKWIKHIRVHLLFN